MSPLFSVVIPTFNRADLLVQAVQSVLDQTEADLEVVVSDNVSTDATRETVERFSDARVRYVSPPRHLVLPDSWEFARTHATGQLVMALSDDDALLSTALEQFATAHKTFDADFLFCTMAEYRDHSFPNESNTLHVPAHTGELRAIDRDVFLSRLMEFHPKYNTHPSGYVFTNRLATEIASRNNGRFFQTQGVEYFAWPVAAAMARNIANVDLPIVVVGRTAKSWGTNMVLTNPGQDKIDQFLSDVQTDRRHTPLTDFSFNNMALEGILTAKEAFPEELAPWPVDYGAFVREMHAELDRRRAQGIDVSRQSRELEEYAAEHPSLRDGAPSAAAATYFRRVAERVRNVPARLSRKRVRAAYVATGDSEGFVDALGASRFLAQRLT